MGMIVLQAEDAKDWVYKGEGAANLILSYNGSSPSMLGKVLRIKKILKDKASPSKNCLVLSRHEQLLWSNIAELMESQSVDCPAQAGDCLAQVYTKHVMSQLLGANHVDGGVCVSVSRDFLSLIEKNVLKDRPVWRANASEIDVSADYALLIFDHSVFTGTPRESICIAVEIKPKCGFLPSSEYILEENSVKKNVTRYKMHQLLKLCQGEISTTSEYDPLDLFSRSKERICNAITSLFSTPQNNFRVFVNGSLVFGGMGSGTGIHPHQKTKFLEDLVKFNGLQLASFVELISETIFQSRVLDRLLATQELDVLDIEGAIHLYYDIISQPCSICKSMTDPELLDRYSSLHAFPLEKSLKIVRDYLISATAKDCSLIISFRPGENGRVATEDSSVCLKSLNQTYDYKAYFVDLDMKPLHKMVHYYKLDQKIVKFYTKAAEDERET